MNVKTRLHFLHGEDPSHNLYRYASNTQKAWSICSFITVLLKFCGGSHIGPLIPRLLYPFNMAAWVNLIIQPEIQLGLEGHQARAFTLFAAIFSETIWFHRNQTVHKAIPPDIHVIIITLRQRYREHACAWTDKNFRSNQRWIPPPPQSTWNFNCHAACRGGQSFIPGVCSDSAGQIISAWTDSILSSNPLLAELSALFTGMAISPFFF